MLYRPRCAHTDLFRCCCIEIVSVAISSFSAGVYGIFRFDALIFSLYRCVFSWPIAEPNTIRFLNIYRITPDEKQQPNKKKSVPSFTRSVLLVHVVMKIVGKCFPIVVYTIHFVRAKKCGGKRWIVVSGVAQIKSCTLSVLNQVFIPYHCHFKNVFDTWIVVRPVFTQNA